MSDLTDFQKAHPGVDPNKIFRDASGNYYPGFDTNGNAIAYNTDQNGFVIGAPTSGGYVPVSKIVPGSNPNNPNIQTFTKLPGGQIVTDIMAVPGQIGNFFSGLSGIGTAIAIGLGLIIVYAFVERR